MVNGKAIVMLALSVSIATPAHAANMAGGEYQISNIKSGNNSASASFFIGGGNVAGTVMVPSTVASSPNYSIRPVAREALGGLGSHSGDLNGDGVVDVVDALLALRASVGIFELSAGQIERGDVSPVIGGVPAGDDRIDISDSVLILRRSVGLAW